MIKLNLFVIFLLCFLGLNGQLRWNKITPNTYFELEDIILDSNYNVYLSIHGIPNCYKFNLLNSTPQPIQLPALNTYYYSELHQKTLLLDNDLSLIELLELGGRIIPYKLINDSTFRKEEQPDSLSYDYNGTEKYNEENELFFYYFSSISKKMMKWSYRNYLDVFKVENKDDQITGFNPYTKDTNYVFVVDNNTNKCKVYEYNTQGSKLIISNFLSTNKFGKTYATKEGHVFIPSDHGLYHYYPDHKTFELILIDSSQSSNVSIQDFRRSVNNKTIIVQINNQFYFSDDNCKTWYKPKKFNNNFPNGVIKKFYFKDSLAAIVQIENECNQSDLYIFKPKQLTWELFDVHQSLWTYSNIRINNDATKIFASKNNCGYYSTDDEGLHWNPILLDKLKINHLEINELDNYITYRDNKLFISFDYGNIWQMINKFSGQIYSISKIDANKFFLIGSSDLSQPYLYYTDDGGKTWKLVSSKFESSLLYSKIQYDPFTSQLISISDRSRVLCSKDNGISWQLDPRFLIEKLTVNVLYFTKEGKCLINGIYKNKQGIYLTEDFINLDFISEPAEFEYLKENYIVRRTLSNGLELSVDYGSTWITINYNLPLKDTSAIKFLYSIQLDSKNNLIVSIGSDGIYKSSEALVNTEDKSRDHSSFYISPNPAIDHLSFNLSNIKEDSKIELEIYDMIGRLLFGDIMTKDNTVISVEKLNSGIYNLKVTVKNGKSYNCKFVVQK